MEFLFLYNYIIRVMILSFPENFENFFFMFHRVWLNFNGYEQKCSVDEIKELENKIFVNTPVVVLKVSAFSDSVIDNFFIAVRDIIRKRMGAQDKLKEVLFYSPFENEKTFNIVLNIYLSLKLRELIEIFKKKDSLFISSRKISQSLWRIKKASLLTGQIYLPDVSEERQETLKTIFLSFYGINLTTVPHSVDIEEIFNEVRLSMDSFLSFKNWRFSSVEYERYFRVYKDLCALAFSNASFYVRLIFFMNLLEYFVAFFNEKTDSG